MLTKVYIPYKGYFSSPFSRWQGSMANENSIELAAETAKGGWRRKTGIPRSLIICFWESRFISCTVFMVDPGRQP